MHSLLACLTNDETLIYLCTLRVLIKTVLLRWCNSAQSSSQKPRSGHHCVRSCRLFAGCQGDGEFGGQRHDPGNSPDSGPESESVLLQACDLIFLRKEF